MDGLGAGASNRDAVRDTLAAVGGPVIMTTLTTMAGFLSLLMINSGAIRELGVIDRLIPRLRGWPSILLAAALLAVFIPGTLLLRANFSMIDLYKPSTEVRPNIDLTAEVLGGSIPISVAFEAPDRIDTEVANAVLELQDEAEARGIAGASLSAYAIIRSMWSASSENDGYPERAAVARARWETDTGRAPADGLGLRHQGDERPDHRPAGVVARRRARDRRRAHRPHPAQSPAWTRRGDPHRRDARDALRAHGVRGDRHEHHHRHHVRADRGRGHRLRDPLRRAAAARAEKRNAGPERRGAQLRGNAHPRERARTGGGIHRAPDLAASHAHHAHGPGLDHDDGERDPQPHPAAHDHRAAGSAARTRFPLPRATGTIGPCTARTSCSSGPTSNAGTP